MSSPFSQVSFLEGTKQVTAHFVLSRPLPLSWSIMFCLSEQLKSREIFCYSFVLCFFVEPFAVYLKWQEGDCCSCWESGIKHPWSSASYQCAVPWSPIDNSIVQGSVPLRSCFLMQASSTLILGQLSTESSFHSPCWSSPHSSFCGYQFSDLPDKFVLCY